MPNGTRLGPYELNTLLGVGGMGEVYRARDTRLDRTVAIKVLPRAFAADPDRRSRLEREARAISSLNHPNICALFDVGNHEGIEYLVMEHLEGETLARRLARGPLPVDQVLRVGVEIAAALERAHRQGIVHRDLKPANVMLTKTGAKLLDFGIAKPAPGSAQPVQLTTPAGLPTHTPLTGVGMLVGTIHYMAPEQLEGNPVDARSDVFAFGAVLYEMATGIRAFDGSSQASLIASILERQPAPVTSLQPLTPPGLERIVRICLEKDPDDRWQSAHDVRLALEAVGEATAPVAAATAASRTRRVERMGWATAVALLLVGTLALLGVVLRGRSGNAVAGKPLRLAILPPAGTATTGPLALSTDGKNVAFTAWGDDGVPRLWVRSLEESEARVLQGTEDASLPFWSPDGRSLGFFAQRRLMRVEVAGGPPRALADISDARGGCWTKDDVIVFAPNPGDGIYRIAADGGATTPLTHLDKAHSESSHRWPTCLPDGKHVVYLVLSGERERLSLQSASIDGGAGTRLLAADSGALYSPPGLLLFVRGETLLEQHVDPVKLTLSGEPQPLAEGIWRDPDIDGLRAFAAADGIVAYRRGGNELTRLAWFDREGHELGALGEPGVGSVVALAPDGRRLARSVTERGSTVGGLRLLDLAGQGSKDSSTAGSTRLTFNRWNDIYPVWSPDGRRIAFTSDRDGRYNLYEKAANGSGEETRLLRSDLWDFPEDWSRDGKQLAFTRRDPRTKSDVWVLAMPQRLPRVLLRSEADELQPRFSPDGRFIAYISDESGRSEVYVQTMPPSAAKWQVSTAGGYLPQWRRDGRELYYLAPDLELMAVAVDEKAATFNAAAPRALFVTHIRRSILKGASPYLAAPDGQRFLIDSASGPDLSAPIQVVLGGAGTAAG
ncbi:MAG TPA: protein kinase [Thermoanaerobaculia bacterium]|nr:protein kinase [Thermoanaerobaculia bacterium]